MATETRRPETLDSVEFTVEDTLVVADPCYVDTDDGETTRAVVSDARTSGLSTVVENAAGEWTAEAEYSDEGSWGNRVARLVLTRRGAGYAARGAEVGRNGVDSGQMWAGPAAALPLDYEALLETYRDADGEWVDRSLFEAPEGGAVSSTGYGDGLYSVYVNRDAEGVASRVEVEFIEPPCEGCGYTEDECRCCWRCGISSENCGCCENCGERDCDCEEDW